MPGSRPAGPAEPAAGTTTIDQGTLARARALEPGTIGSQPATSNAESGTPPRAAVSLVFRSAC